MPVSKTAVVQHYLTALFVNIEAATGAATFRRYVDGQPDVEINMMVEQTEFVPLMMAMSDPTKNRRDDITDAVYALAIARGLFQGEIS